MWPILNYFLSCFISALIGSAIFLFFYTKFKKFSDVPKINSLLKSLTIVEITSEEECKDACLKIRSHCQDLSALGFDCEWVSVNGKQRPVALLQLATVHGLCCLFRLCKFRNIPIDLQDILCDYKIIKLGISPLHDSNNLMRDYDVQVRSTLDLRFLYPHGGGLGAMAASEIGVILNKDWRIRCSNWEKHTLTDSEKDYAAKDAFVAIEIFKKWLSTKNNTFSILKENEHSDKLFSIPSEVFRSLDINFSQKHNNSSRKRTTSISSSENCNNLQPRKEKSSYITRKTPLYHNCFMHAPDGELLCSCDRRKAQWYVDRGLAEVLPGEPYSIRLLFEPAARSGDTSTGRFYQHLKQNRCVVCGALDSYLKHNVVPKEYRRHFPSHVKDHQSHDVVLMCVRCHHIASKQNMILKDELAYFCKAPITASKVKVVRELQKLRNSAKALITFGDVIPEKRKMELENEIKMYYKVDTLTQEILNTALNVDINIQNEKNEMHGLKVVNYFIQNGIPLFTLEKLWRKHFIKTMKPQYLPTLWSVNHNHT